MNRVFSVGFFLAFSIFPHPTYADVTFGISAQMDKVKFLEFNDGETVNEEQGNILEKGFTLEYQSDAGQFAFFSVFSGDNVVDYEGFTQLGQLHTTETEYFIKEYQLLLGQRLRHANMYVGIGNYYRERNILQRESVSGVYEEWQQNYALAGLDFLFAQNESSHFRLELQAQSSFDSELLVEFSGFYDAARVEGGQDMSLSAGIEWFKEIGRGWGIRLMPKYQFTEVEEGQSYTLVQNGEALNAQFHQPKLQYEAFSLRCSLQKRFF